MDIRKELARFGDIRLELKSLPLVALDLSMVPIPGRDFAMCKYPVTQGLWELVMGENPSESKGVFRPVVNVSWDDCQKFLEKLNAKPVIIASGRQYRLPTADEWEFACRAGAAGDYCKLEDGTEITEKTLGEVAWFEDNSGGRTHAVGQKKPNAFGLHDILGNVWEWTSPDDGGYRVRIRCGGGWSGDANDCKAGRRASNFPGERHSTFGLRLASVGLSKAERKVAIARAEAEREVVALLAELASNMVAIPGKRYSICKYQVTQALWKAIMGGNPSKFKGENRPVENVSWNDCQEFLKKLNAWPEIKKSGRHYRLPTPYEWKYACRAGGAGEYCKLEDGTEVTKTTFGEVAWFKANSGGNTLAVGRKKPNAFGLYDMLGNVWEWTSTGDDHTRLACGGSWFSSCWRPAHESLRREPDYRDNDLGFRLVSLSEAECKAADAREAERKAANEAEWEAATKAAMAKLSDEIVPIPGKDYAMGKFEVTQALWFAVMGKKPSEFKGADLPVENVSWNDCQEFLKKLNARPEVKASGRTYRLPTVDEWEFACRAGATGDYCKLADGTEITENTLDDVAWFEDNSDWKTHPVGQKKPNAFGLYDMQGNVGEWTSTASHFGGYRVDTRSHYKQSVNCCTWSVNRWGCPPGHRESILGFRLAADK